MKISPNLVNFLVLTSRIKIKILLFYVKVTGNIALSYNNFNLGHNFWRRNCRAFSMVNTYDTCAFELDWYNVVILTLTFVGYLEFSVFNYLW